MKLRIQLKKSKTKMVKNDYLEGLVGALKAAKANIWKRVASELAKPTRQRREINLTKIDMMHKEGFTLVVPGKVLSSGTLSNKVTVAAFAFSQSAKEKITAAGGKVLSLEDALKANADGKKCKLVGQKNDY